MIVQFFSFRDRPLSQTVHFGPRPPTFSLLGRPVSLPWTVHFDPRPSNLDRAWRTVKISKRQIWSNQQNIFTTLRFIFILLKIWHRVRYKIFGTELFINGTEFFINGTESFRNGTESFTNGTELFINSSFFSNGTEIVYGLFYHLNQL